MSMIPFWKTNHPSGCVKASCDQRKCSSRKSVGKVVLISFLIARTWFTSTTACPAPVWIKTITFWSSINFASTLEEDIQNWLDDRYSIRTMHVCAWLTYSLNVWGSMIFGPWPIHCTALICHHVNSGCSWPSNTAYVIGSLRMMQKLWRRQQLYWTRSQKTNFKLQCSRNGQRMERCLVHRRHYFEKEQDMAPDSHSDSNRIWNKVFVVTFLLPFPVEVSNHTLTYLAVSQRISQVQSSFSAYLRALEPQNTPLFFFFFCVCIQCVGSVTLCHYFL